MRRDNHNNFYKSGFSPEDIKYMKLAVRLAEKARGMTNPNPLVGAVIVKKGQIISTGYHKIAGGPHAEIEAINAAGNKELLNGAKIYITLEPCSITGKTPPCVDSLIKYGFCEVIIGSTDPNPMVNGNGIKKLQDAKIRVRAGLLKDIIARQNEIFFKHIQTKRPFICCKIAASIDGKVAAKTSDSKWITGDRSRKTVQDIRREFECILTGIDTILIDDPYLYPRKDSTIRPDIESNRKFYRAVLDSNLRINQDSNIVKTAKEVKTLIFTATLNYISNDNYKSSNNKFKNDSGKSNSCDSGVNNNIFTIFNSSDKKKKLIYAKIKLLKDKGIELINVKKTNSEKLDIKEILKILYERYTITSVLVESGPTLLTQLLKKKLIDKFYLFIAPKIIGGDSSYNIFSELNISHVNDAVKLRFEKIKKIGEDILITAYPVSHYNYDYDYEIH
ncbi:MAG: bifunctional diaminohydroxyphosphoribosylaminopyrimidine deaminase/5-amino-6-(5-phosphoribosylamino)uracil reductase RibD [Actinobacteria bacterium]|nr:bifunctional diaminohydroxyphosphoribosylaminopyrimidine deaminase/5-amino-6-(5-phosphoribosylamino)uracil reductase RibD [Actinomycetota bacterium]MBM3711981.1 bifunctional diaminohydroxyphosphoribosylaminopyrimidine deaminase/5-amino-6-(5-phosphoribosylamino)uracil reductase RibD [Actinomycetota bacterium]